MICDSCGGKLSAGSRSCPACGHTRPPLPPRFAGVELRYIQLRARYETGNLDRDSYRAKLQQMAIKDEDGTYWTIAGVDGRWHKHDGQKWVPADPPYARKGVIPDQPLRTTTPAPAARPQPAAQPAARPAPAEEVFDATVRMAAPQTPPPAVRPAPTPAAEDDVPHTAPEPAAVAPAPAPAVEPEPEPEPAAVAPMPAPAVEPEPAPEPAAVAPAPAPAVEPEPEPEPAAVAPAPAPAVELEPEPEPEPAAVAPAPAPAVEPEPEPEPAAVAPAPAPAVEPEPAPEPAAVAPAPVEEPIPTPAPRVELRPEPRLQPPAEPAGVDDATVMVQKRAAAPPPVRTPVPPPPTRPQPAAAPPAASQPTADPWQQTMVSRSGRAAAPPPPLPAATAYRPPTVAQPAPRERDRPAEKAKSGPRRGLVIGCVVVALVALALLIALGWMAVKNWDQIMQLLQTGGALLPPAPQRLAEMAGRFRPGLVAFPA